MLVLNRATAPAGITVAAVAAAIKGELVAQLPDDLVLALRAERGMPFVQGASQAPLSREFDRLAALVIGEPPAEAEPEAQLAGAAAGAGAVAAGGIGRWIRPPLRRKAGERSVGTG